MTQSSTGEASGVRASRATAASTPEAFGARGKVEVTSRRTLIDRAGIRVE